MVGKLLQQARKDVAKITTSGGFEDCFILKTKDGSIEFAVKGLSSGHTERFDNEGNSVNSSSFHVNIPEMTLIKGEYPYRNYKGKVALKDHQIIIADNTGTPRSYVITEVAPNTTTGLIVCILGRSV